MINSTKRWRKKLRINLQPPAELGESEPKRKDRTGRTFWYDPKWDNTPMSRDDLKEHLYGND